MSASVYTPSFNTLEMHPPRLLNRPTYNQTPTLQLKPMPPLQNPHRASQATDVQPSTSHFAGEHATSSHDEGSLKSSTLPHVRSGYSSALTRQVSYLLPRATTAIQPSRSGDAQRRLHTRRERSKSGRWISRFARDRSWRPFREHAMHAIRQHAVVKFGNARG